MTDSRSDNAILHNMPCSDAIVDRFSRHARQDAGETAIANVVIGERVSWVDHPRDNPDLAPSMRIHWLWDERGRIAGELVRVSKQAHENESCGKE